MEIVAATNANKSLEYLEHCNYYHSASFYYVECTSTTMLETYTSIKQFGAPKAYHAADFMI